MMCKFCDTKIADEFYIGEKDPPYISLVLENIFGQVFIIATGSNTELYSPKYCPECGRKLKDDEEA